MAATVVLIRAKYSAMIDTCLSTALAWYKILPSTIVLDSISEVCVTTYRHILHTPKLGADLGKASAIRYVRLTMLKK